MIEEDGMECVVHYRDSCSTFSTLKSLSQNQYGRLLKAKSARSDCDIAIMHEEQCSSIPHNGFDKNHHGIHLQPCYKKFSAILCPSQQRG